MALSDITRQAVLSAVSEFDSLGREQFLKRYGFGKAKGYFLVHDGREYDSKAIVGVAHAYVSPGSTQPLGSDEFSGGEATVAKLLSDLGFEVEYFPRVDWYEDELVLALDLYMRHRQSPPSEGSTEVAELSKVLRRLALLNGLKVSQTFRNGSGVYLKMMNFKAIDPENTAAGNKGMPNGGDLAPAVWKKYAGNPDALREKAALIWKIATTHALSDPLAITPDEEPYEAQEGRITFRLHRSRERDRKLIERKRSAVLSKTGTLACEACEFDFGATYGEIGAGFIEVHHLKPVADIREGETTKLADLALLCANCHRVAHRREEPLSVAEISMAIRDHH